MKLLKYAADSRVKLYTIAQYKDFFVIPKRNSNYLLNKFFDKNGLVVRYYW